LLSLPVWAEDAAPNLIPVIEVNASSVDVHLASRTSFEASDLEHLGKSDLGDIIEMAPGVNVRSGGRGEPRVDIRGFDQRATLFTLDGVPIYEPYNGIINFNLLRTEYLDAVEITRGSASSLYGPNGMAGAIHLRTRAAPPALAARASTTWRDSNFWDARASATKRVRRFSFLAAGTYLDSSGFPVSADFTDRPESRRRFEDGGRRSNSDRTEWSAFAHANYALSNSATVRVVVLESHAGFGIPPRTGSFAPQFRRVTQQELTHAHVSVAESDWRGSEVALSLFGSRYASREVELDPIDRLTVLSAIDVDSYDVGGITRLTREILPDLRLDTMLQIRQAQASVEDGATGNKERPDFTTSSLGTELGYEVFYGLRLLAGLSVDLQSGSHGSDWEPNPQAGAAYDLTHWATTRISVSRKTRFPTLRERFDPVAGNVDLVAERSWSYEMGQRVMFESLEIDVALFRADVDDLIESSGGRNQEPAPAQNLTAAVLQGVEVGGDWRATDALRLRSNYTFLDAKAENPLDARRGAKSRIQHRPRHRAALIGELLLPLRIGARFEAQYVGEQVDRFGTSVHLADAFLLHAHVSKEVLAGLDVQIGAENLLDEDYEEALGMPRPGRWAYVAVRGALR